MNQIFQKGNFQVPRLFNLYISNKDNLTDSHFKIKGNYY